MSSSSSKGSRLATDLKDLVLSHGLEDEFLKKLGLNSLDDLNPKEFQELKDRAPPTITKSAVSAAPQPPKQLPLTAAEASAPYTPTAASDMLMPYIGIHINYRARKRISGYYPSSLMMDYIIHLINGLLSDNFYFRRSCPNYHPYIIRLYYGVLFWIQCLRASNDVRALDCEQQVFLTQFLAAFPPESLTVSSPLLSLFKTLCSSTPDLPAYGKVYPIAPPAPGPPARSSFMRDDRYCFALPNVPGIFALLENLNSLINGANPTYPSRGKHIPVTANRNAATVFGHHSFPAVLTSHDAWCLNSSGLQYPCEADKKLHEAFAERYDDFDFPITADTDNLELVTCFMSMDTSMSWFAQVREVAALEASFFEGSGTLADCPPHGISANQLVVVYSTPLTPTPDPTRSCDPASLLPFSFRLMTSARSVAELSEAMAASSQTNVQFPINHPWLYTPNVPRLIGPYWDVRPRETSNIDDSSHHSIFGIIRGLSKPKG